MPRESTQFVFMTCRPGAENAVKDEVARAECEWRLSFSRKGFLTFKNIGKRVDDRRLAERNWTFAHAHGISLGKLTGDCLEEMAAAFWRLDGVADILPGEVTDIHVFQPDVAATADEVMPSLVTPLCQQISNTLLEAMPQTAPHVRITRNETLLASPRNAFVLDVMVLQPNEWWIGCHRAARRHERWPGGAIPVRLPGHAVSRAYAKIEEAIQWSGLPLMQGDECVEIGCAPGGASQALLDRGLFVTGIDPADVDPVLLENARFRHLKKRGNDVRRYEFHGVRWLAADMNIAPAATLDEVEGIVTHPGVAIRGLILTLKLSNWQVAFQLSEIRERVRGWGYREVRTRQLVTGGQEVCLVALRRKALRRLAKKPKHQRQKPQNPLRADAPHSPLSQPHF